MNKQFFFILLFVSFLMACDSPPQFIGVWELESLKLQEDVITAADLGNPLYTFDKNHTYNIQVSDLVQNGTWSLEGSTLRLIENENPDSENILVVVEANEYKFEYTTGQGNTMTHVILRRK